VPKRIEKIVSGGQTGVDRGALDAAIDLGVPYGGWCPHGRRAEDGRIPARYALVETAATAYAVRTERNVRDSDGTLVLCVGAPRRGTALTCDIARRLRKPLRVVDVTHPPPLADLRMWITTSAIRVLNVAGPRESAQPGMQRHARAFVTALLGGARRAPVWPPTP
jgi:hypothetical protein